MNPKENNSAPAGAFTPPTLEEVEAYCRERGNCVNAQRFIDFYTSNGWMVGKTKMKDWKASVRTWEQEDKKQPAVKKGMKCSYPTAPAAVEDDLDRLERMLGGGA